MIRFVAKVTAFAVTARLRGDRQAWRFARALIWESNARLGHFAAAGPLTLPTVALHELLGDRELSVRTTEFRVENGGTSPYETVCIAAITRFIKPRCIFEFGTFKGQNTLLFTQHAPESTRIYTLDLPLQDVANMGLQPAEADLQYIRKPVIGECFQHLRDTDRITQLLGDSTSYDFSPFHRQCDLIFVDAAHSYAFVKSDSQNALKMLRPGGVILWHDYKPGCPGVVRALHEAARSHEIFEIKNTSLAVHGLRRQCDPTEGRKPSHSEPHAPRHRKKAAWVPAVLSSGEPDR